MTCGLASALCLSGRGGALLGGALRHAMETIIPVTRAADSRNGHKSGDGDHGGATPTKGLHHNVRSPNKQGDGMMWLSNNYGEYVYEGSGTCAAAGACDSVRHPWCWRSPGNTLCRMMGKTTVLKREIAIANTHDSHAHRTRGSNAQRWRHRE